MIAPRLHRHIVADAAQHDALFDRGALGQGFVDVGLQRQLLTAPPAAVGRDDELGAGVVIAVGDGLARETTENHRVDGTDSRASQHRNHEFGHQRHVDRHHVATADA